MKKILLLILLFCAAAFVFSADFGLLVDQQFEANNTGIEYNPLFIPWFSWNGNNGLSLYFSGRLSMQYDKPNEGDTAGWGDPVLIPELARFALSYRNSGFFITTGRVSYTDALGMTAFGLFDGFRLEASLPFGSISAAALYSGLLYRKSAEINMTAADTDINNEPWGFDNFGNYFASKRLLASLRFDTPLAEYHTLTFEALAQFDLNDSDEKLHSQYGAVLVELYPQGKAGLIIGALFEAMENSENEFTAALGAMVRFKTDIPGSLNDGLNITMRFGSGSWNETFCAFTPVTSPAQGEIFPYSISGLTMISADYSALFHRTFKAEAALRYFLRSHEDPESEGMFYGGEVWASAAWQPFNELRLIAGGGAFFPGMGNILVDIETLWKARVGLIISF